MKSAEKQAASQSQATKNMAVMSFDSRYQTLNAGARQTDHTLETE